MSHSGPEFYVLTLIPALIGFIAGALSLRAAQLYTAARRDRRGLERHANAVAALARPRSNHP